MSNAPFKIAFWVMGLAFCLTLLLTALKPQELRVAMNSNSSNVPAPDTVSSPGSWIHDDNSLLAVNASAPAAEVTEEFSNEVSEIVDDKSLEDVNRAEVSEPVAQPIRVASADLDARWTPSPSSPTLAPELQPTMRDEDGACRVATASQEEIDILVPEPMVPIPDPSFAEAGPSLTDEVIRLKKEVIRYQLADARQELEMTRLKHEEQVVRQVEDEIAALREQIALMRKKQSRPAPKVEPSTPPTIPEPNPMETLPAEPLIAQAVQETVQEAPVAPPQRQSSIKVEPGTLPKRYDFTFERAEIQEALTTVAKKIGWQLVFKPDVQGTFSGRFENADPQQAFAAMVKSQEYGLSYRGSLVIVRGKKDPKIR